MHVLTMKKTMFRLGVLGLLLLAVPLFAQPTLPELSINDVSVTEGKDKFAVFTLSLNSASSQDVRLDFKTFDGSATAPGDYQRTSNIVTIPKLKKTTTISIPIVDDKVVEGTETFGVSLGNASNATVKDGSGIATILDNDKARLPEVSINDIKVPEHGKFAVFTVSLNSVSTNAVSVFYNTNDISARAIQPDYKKASGFATVAKGKLSTTISIAIVDDPFPEPSETFKVALSKPSGAILGKKSTGIATILDNDKAKLPEVTINDVKVNEPGKFAIFTVSLSSASLRTVTVAFTTTNGTAIAGVDYKALRGGVRILPKTKSAKISVPFINDLKPEPTEDFFVKLSGASGAVLGKKSTGKGTIFDDDKAPPKLPEISINNVKVNENGKFAVFTVSLNSVSANAVKVAFSTMDNTARAPGDYKKFASVATIPKGKLSTTISVPIVDDNVHEPTETFFVNLSKPIGAVLGKNNIGTGTILDNDKAKRTLADVKAKVDKLLDDPNTPKKAKKDLKRASEKIERAASRMAQGKVKNAFSDIQKAVKSLKQARKRDVPVSDCIDDLVGFARQLALDAIAQAQQFAGSKAVDKQLAKAAKAMAKAQKELDKGKADKAISKFKSAWKSAQKALAKAGQSATKAVTVTLESEEAEIVNVIPTEFALEGNYPNPFNPSTTIRFALPQASDVKLTIYNIRGQLVRTLISGPMAAGRHNQIWNGRDQRGVQVATGTYVYRIQAGDFVATRKLMLMK